MSEKENTSYIPKPIYEALQNNPAIEKLNYESGPLPLSSLISEALIIAMSFTEKKRPILVVKNNLYNAQRLYDRISTLLPESECALFGVDESLRVEAIASSPEMIANKVDTLSSLLEDSNKVVITCTSGLLRYLPFPNDFKEGCINLKVGEEVEVEELKRKLRANGYYQTSHIDQPLCFASRGGILDVYSINYENPIRIEFFDTEIESIRFFDFASQKTIVPINEVKIVPASDVIFSESQLKEIQEKAKQLLEKENDTFLTSNIETDLNLIESGIRVPRLYPYMALLSECAGIWDYMDHPLIIYSNKEEIEESVKKLQNETTSYIQEMVQEKKYLPRFAMWHDFHRVGKDCKVIEEDPFQDNISNIVELHLPNELLSKKLKYIHKLGKVLLCVEEKDTARILNTCVEQEIPYYLIKEEEELKEGINILIHPLREGFHLLTHSLYVVTANELLEINRHRSRYESKFLNAEIISDYQELEPGDYVVHATHGVGQYVGMETREILGLKKDFLKIIYRGNAELLVPLDQFRLVRKFVSREGIVPKLNKLGSGEWEKTKARIEESVNDIAERLLELYSNRTQKIGHAYQKDSEEQIQFDNEFEYELTKDQQKAVEEVKKDMESSLPMDRLVCGDVGFGKTEIAIRAAFKAASENKQVAMLCPTTILSEQHAQTFKKRFEGHPFKVAVLNRFVTTQNAKKTIQELKEGKIDILIGTHRILSKDVVFKDLGLLIIDEEQRFGVEHKEKIKELKNEIDVLTLSATPIPRTLQMSLVGIRQLSQLETPPQNRYSVQTYVVEKNKGLIVDAIEKELARGGQVFYLYNRIEDIYGIARNLQESIPDAKIGVVHGKMDRESIEDVMYQFVNKDINILVCTTIIENGIDIPNANTILIDNAHLFGLSQIYQIKGRVGRSDRVAYAYLLIPPRKQLNEEAQKRLQAVKEFAKLGSGYKIAMRDLTIRGAGDLLGADQSGFIDTVGIDMYIEMLENAIKRQKGEVIEEEVEVKHANVSTDTYIPKNFAPDDFDKISMYQQIETINDIEELDQYLENIKDQYGSFPEEVKNLFLKKRLEILINDEDVDSYKERNKECELVFSISFSDKVDGVKLFELFAKVSKDINLRYKNNKISATLPKIKGYLKVVIEMITESKKAVKHES